MIDMLARTLLAMALMLVPGAALAAAPGCAGEALAAGTRMVPVTVQGKSRPVLVYVPKAYDGHRPMPLLFDLHGSGSTGRQQLEESGLAETAEAEGFLIAAPDAAMPEGKGHAWNIPGVPTVSGRLPDASVPSDVAYIGAIIDALSEHMCVDPRAVYSTGLSGGGRMTSWLGCVMADRIAAVAPVVGLRAGNPDPQDKSRPDPKSCRPTRPMPVMAFAGKADTTNPIAGGGAPYWQYSMHAAEQRWAALNGCTGAPTSAWIDRDTYVERYGQCRDGAEVAAQVDVDGVHSWAVVDNDAMWRFLSAHRLPD